MRYSLLFAALFGLSTTQSTASAQETSQDEQSGIQISASSTAQVYIDNQLLGETPFQASLPAGEYTIRLSADGFDPYTRRLNIIENNLLQLDAKLDIGGGTIEFQAETSGAQLQLDGGSERYILPIRFDELPLGEHSWKIIAKGHDPKEGTFSSLKGHNIFMYKTLESSVGKVSFHSTPEGATVFLDGEEIGQTPLELTDLDAAEHSVSFQYKGYASTFRTLDTSDGERGDVKVAMSTIGSKVIIKTGYKDAIVFIGDIPFEKGRRIRVGQMEKGAYPVRIVADGYKVLQSNITVPTSGRIKYKASLVPSEESGTPDLTQVRSGNSDVNWRLWGAIGAGTLITATGSYLLVQALEPEPAPSGDTVLTLP